MEQSKITDETLMNYLLGECNAAEQLSVQSWIEATAANRKQYTDLKLIWNQAGKLARSKAVDVDAAWETFRHHIAVQKAQKKTPVLMHFLKAAAVLLLLVGVGWLGRHYTYQQQNEVTLQGTSPFPFTDTLRALDDRAIAAVTAPKVGLATTRADGISTVAKTATTAPQKKTTSHKYIAAGNSPNITKPNTSNMLSNYHSQSDFICNGTPCPIEICIYQTILCADGQHSSVSTCNILQPDQSGQIPYKALDKIAPNCAATIDEIRIKRMNTGETIVLNANSKPSTAQELFNYLTGQKKGDILAGIFHTDCNNHNNDQQLTLDNKAGSLILQ